MCRPVNCKTTWAGCGQHVDQVMAGVPRSNRCAGHQSEASITCSSIFSRMLGRG